MWKDDVVTPKSVIIALDAERRVSGLLQVPRKARACYVLAHGAGAGMPHPFMAAIAAMKGCVMPAPAP